MIELFVTSLWMPIAFQCLISKKVRGTRRAVCLLVCSMIMMVSVLLTDSSSELLLVADLLTMAVVLYKGMRCTKFELLYIPLVYIEIALVSNGVNLLLEKCMHISTERVFEYPYVWYSYSMTTLMVLLVSCLLNIGIQWTKKLLDNRYKKASIILISGNILLCTIVFLVNIGAARINNFPDEVEATNLVILCVYTILLIIITAIVLKVFHDKENMEQERQQYNNLMQYSRQIEEMYTNLRAFKHDYVNILTSMSGYMESKDYEGLEEYFHEHILPASEKISRDDYRLNLLKNIKDSALKGLISSKLIYANEKGLDVFIDIMEEIDHIAMKTIDISRIMGIFLDNAIEAALETEEKEIKFNMVKEENHVAIILMNSFQDCKVPISKMEQEGYSTKGKNRGIGLSNVKNILSKYDNVYKMTGKENGYFMQKLEIMNEAE